MMSRGMNLIKERLRGASCSIASKIDASTSGTYSLHSSIRSRVEPIKCNTGAGAFSIDVSIPNNKSGEQRRPDIPGSNRDLEKKAEHLFFKQELLWRWQQRYRRVHYCIATRGIVGSVEKLRCLDIWTIQWH